VVRNEAAQPATGTAHYRNRETKGIRANSRSSPQKRKKKKKGDSVYRRSLLTRTPRIGESDQCYVKAPKNSKRVDFLCGIERQFASIEEPRILFMEFRRCFEIYPVVPDCERGNYYDNYLI